MIHLSKLEVTKMQMKRIEKEIRDTPYHKATEHHIGRLKARLSKLKDSLDSGPSRGGGGGGGYAIKKHGDATVILIGPPSCGKSTLINKLTNAKSKVAPYSFTTVSVIPGMMVYKDAKIQILDVPGLIEGAEEGKGRGREVLSVTRGANLIVIMSDIERPNSLELLTQALFRNGIRINTSRPNVRVEKKVQGGLNIVSNIKQDLSKETFTQVAMEMGVRNADIAINEKITVDRLIDAFSPNRVYIPAIFVLNKVDLINKSDSKLALNVTFNDICNICNISADKNIGINEFKEKIWEQLEFIRIYLVKDGQQPSLDNPIIVKVGTTLLDLAEKIGGEFAQNKKSAKIWGQSAKFYGQEVSLQTKAQDGMQVRFI